MINIIKKILFYLLCISVTILICFPIYLMIKSSIEPSIIRFNFPPKFIPQDINFSSYINVIREVHVVNWITNSLIVTILSVVFILAIAVPAGHAVALYKYSGKKFMMFFILFTQMVPVPIIVVPMYVIFAKLKLINSLFGLIIVNTAFNLPFATWILVGFFSKIPREIMESARIDGCSELGVFLKISVPISKPILITISAISFFAVWNEFLFANVFISDGDKWLATVGLSTFIGQFSIDYQSMMTVSTLYLLPSLLIYFILGRYIVQGIATGYSK